MYGGNHLKINCARPTLGTTELRSIYIPLKTYLPKVISSDGTAHKTAKRADCVSSRSWFNPSVAAKKAPVKVCEWDYVARKILDNANKQNYIWCWFVCSSRLMMLFHLWLNWTAPCWNDAAGYISDGRNLAAESAVCESDVYPRR